VATWYQMMQLFTGKFYRLVFSQTCCFYLLDLAHFIAYQPLTTGLKNKLKATFEKPLCFENNSSSIYAKFGSNCSKDF
jgi:hypothetical protein